MVKHHFSTMCLICTVVSVVSVSILVGLWTFQFHSFLNPMWSATVPSHCCRLHERLHPISYNITLWPRLHPNSEGLYIFTGNSTVVFRCVKETDLILIHANKLNLTADATLSTLSGSTAPSITSTRTVSTTQYLVFHLSDNLKSGEWYTLHTQFVGELSNDLGGFYRSEYREDGRTQIVVTYRTHHTHNNGSVPGVPDVPCVPCVLGVPESDTSPVFNITLLHLQ